MKIFLTILELQGCDITKCFVILLQLQGCDIANDL